MESGIRTSLLVAMFSVLLAACGGISDSTPKQLVVENHWGGNTNGGGSALVAGGDAVSNFIVDVATLKSSQTGNSEWAPLVITKSYWDETNWGDGGYAAGKRVTKGQFFYEPHDDTHWPGIAFDETTYNGIKATIAHPSAMSEEQQGYEDQGMPLTKFAGNQPFVKLSDGRNITSVAYPTGVAFDNFGRLWVADNGPDQNFKIFNVPASGTPTQASTFGETGGVIAGPSKGLTGEKRFWGPRGVGFGDNGEIVVGTSGIPGQIHGGTDIRAFDSSGKALWDLKGLFMHAPDIDPTSNGTQIYTAAQRFEMNYDKAPGKSWRQAAVTLDPFRFPGDPRLLAPYNIAYVRVVNGKRFLFAADMMSYAVAIFRFEADSDIAIPAAFIGIRSSQQGASWTQGKEPVWDAGLDINKTRRLMWRDTNGNGAVDAGEFSDVFMPGAYSFSFDVDDGGNIWAGGGLGEYTTKWGVGGGGNLVIPFGDIDTHGVPFSGSVPKFVSVPSTLVPAANLDRGIARIRYLSATDTAVLAIGEREDYYMSSVYVFDGLQKSAKPKLRFTLDLGYNDLGAQYADILQTDTSKMVLPVTMAADADYIYVGYIDRGPDAKVRGEITVYSMIDGHKVGWIVPGAETNHFSGNFDMHAAIQVRKLADGTRIITAEENGGGKFMVYRWKP